MAYTKTKKIYKNGSSHKISRSKIELFIQCPCCFYLDQKKGVKRPSMPSFTLNSAVDFLFKKEFDMHRVSQKSHPLMEKYKIDAVPFQNEKIEEWRHNFTGIQFEHVPTDLLVFGAVDDIWINKKGQLHVVDYKSTSKDEEVTLEDKWKESYKRQVEIYQWLLKKNGFNVSDIAYFVYANGKKDSKAFDAKLEFDISILEYKGKTDWIEETLFKIKDVLEDESMPKRSVDCEYCSYRKEAYKIENEEGEVFIT